MVRLFLGVLSLLLLGCTTPSPSAESTEQAAGEAVPAADAFEFPQRPNIIVVLIDTLRRDHLELYGYERPTTPFLKTLAEEGIVAENAWSQAPQTFLSTATLLTSRRFPLTHELTPGEARVASKDPHPRVQAIQDANVTLAEVFTDAGYDTFAVFTNPHHHPASGFRQGFAHSVYLPPESGERPYGRGVEVHRRFFEHLDAQADGETVPFFAYLHLMEVHSPYRPPRALRKLFVTQQGKDLYTNGRPESPPEEADLTYMRALYDGEIRFVDGILEALVDDLRARGLWENTLLVITSDHGDEFFEHGGFGHGKTVYSEMLRVPMLFAGAGLERHPAAGGRLAGLLRNLDLAPTLTEIAGIEKPGSFEGTSLLRALRSQELDGRSNRLAIARHPTWRSLTDGRWHLIAIPTSAATYLYDVEADPAQQSDVAAKHPDIVRKMVRRLGELEEERKQSEKLAANLAAGGEEPSPEVMEQLRALGYLD